MLRRLLNLTYPEPLCTNWRTITPPSMAATGLTVLQPLPPTTWLTNVPVCTAPHWTTAQSNYSTVCRACQNDNHHPNLPPILVSPTDHLFDPVWLLPSPVCPGFSPPRKANTPPEVLRQLFLEHVANSHSHSTHLYTDGSKRADAVGLCHGHPYKLHN